MLALALKEADPHQIVKKGFSTCLPHNFVLNELGNLALGDHGVAHVHTAILPLDGAVHVHCIAQPVVRRPSASKDQNLYRNQHQDRTQ